MAFARNWDESDPDGSIVNASDIDREIRQTKVDIRERIESILPGWSDDSEDPKVFPKVILQAGSFSAATGSAVTIPWTNNVVEEGGEFIDIATDDQNISIPEDGTYLIILHVEWIIDGTGARRVWVGGPSFSVDDAASGLSSVPTAATQTQQVALVRKLTSGDTIDGNVAQDSGGSLDVNSARIEVIRLGP